MSDKPQFNERVQGAAAHESGKKRNIVARAILRLIGGKRAPTRHAEAKLAMKGQQWYEGQKQDSEALARRRGEVAVVHGVEAAKLTYAQAAASRNKYDAAAGVKMLVKNSEATRSWNVIQSAVTPAGRRVTELPAWQEAITHDPELYQLVMNNRPDRLPDVIQYAEQRAGFGYADGNLTTDKLNLLAKYSLEEAINRFFAVDTVGSWDKGFFEEIGRLDDPELSQMLFSHLGAIRTLGSRAGETMAQLGGPKAKAVNSALASIGKSYESLLA